MSAQARGEGLPLVAVVGRPNVGKSSLVNRMIGRRDAIVQESPGVTRDRRHFVAEWAGRSFEVIDTGGLEPGPTGLEERVAEQAQIAVEAADVIVLVVDNSTGPVEDDHTVAQMLRRAGKPVLVAANKADEPADEPAASIFYRLGLGEPIPLSALHGRGSGDFLEAVVEALPERPGEGVDAWASVAIVGRPNVGKSSILNRLLGEPRSIVHEVPGTTRDPVDSYVELPGGRTVRIVDTAGMRRRVRVHDPIEYYGLVRSRRALASADAAVLVVDASEGVTSHDQRIAEEVVESGRACVVALNKWDAIPADQRDRQRLAAAIDRRLRFLDWATVIRTSALTGRATDRILPAAADAVAAHRTRIPTVDLNRIVAEAQQSRPHPRTGGRAVKVLYAVQAGVAPPRILLFANGRLVPSYLRFLEHRIRAFEPFAGSPVQLVPRLRSRPKVKG